MRFVRLSLVCIFLLTVWSIGRAADLLTQVPTNDAVYAQLQLLDHRGLLAEGQGKLLSEPRQRSLTHYDIAYLLVEPLERCVALVSVQEAQSSLPEQRRRAEMAYLAISKLSSTETDELLTTLEQLLRGYSSDINQLSPGLAIRTLPALRKLRSPSFQPWLKTQETDSADLMPVFHVSITPHAQTGSSSDRLSFLIPPTGGRMALFQRGETGHGSGEPAIISTRPMSSLEAAADLAIGRFRVYGSLSTLPGQDPAMMILKPDGTGKAMLGLQIDVLRIKDLGISGIFEYHIMRYGDDPRNLDTDTGAVGGIGLHW